MSAPLLEALARVDDWLCAALHGIDPSLGERPEEYLFRCKCLNELAAYLAWRRHFAVKTPGSALNLLHRHVLSEVGGTFLDLAARDPARILVFASALSYALRHGALSGPRRALAMHVLSPAFAWSAERLPCRQLDLLQACAAAGIAMPLDPRIAARASSLAFPPSPLQADRESYYSLTHSVFYAALLGVMDVADLPQLHETIEGGLCRATVHDDQDLALELVACAQASGLPDSPGQSHWLGRATAEILQHGALRTTRSIAVQGFVAQRPEDSEWAERVHVTQVAGMALSAAICSGADRNSRCSASTSSEVCALGEALDALQRRRWTCGLDAARRVGATACPHPLHKVLYRHMSEFIQRHRKGGGRFGHLHEELIVFRRLRPGADFAAEVETPVRLAAEAAISALSETDAERRTAKSGD